MKRFAIAFVLGLILVVGCAGRTSRVATPVTIASVSASAESAKVVDDKYTSFTGDFRIAVAYTESKGCNPGLRAEAIVAELLESRGVPPYDVRAFARPDSSVCAFPHVAEGKVVVAYKGDLAPLKRALVEETMSWLKPTPVASTTPKSKFVKK